ncbi:MAG: tripartite tricarboxylate transporter substrate binding protein [Rubrivivax sp.]|nr:tripartite tricarboxylate transporter substrate binding protein [Rubrivivax sp.]
MAARAQDYPNRPLRLIVPQGPGGGSDVGARVIAERLGRALGQQIVVENRPGAGGSIGVDAAAKAAPDGYTLVLGSNTTMAANVSLYSKLPYNPLRDFTPLGLVFAATFGIVVHPSVPATSLKELVALAKSRPGQLNYGSGTSSAQICTEMLKFAAGIDLAYVPYKGSPQALNDLLSGQVQLICDPLATALPQVKAGKLRILAVTSRQRSAFAPEVPTVAEAGVPDVEYTAWLGLFVPSSTPKEVTARLSAELMKVLRQPETAEALTRAGLEPLALAPDDAMVLWKSDIERQAAVVKRAGMKIE